MKKCNLKTCVASALLVVSVASCEGGDSEGNDPVLANIVTDDDLTIEFYQLDDADAIIVSEVGPADVPSRLAAFVEQDATPLEMYLALAQGDEVPVELEIHHAVISDVEPRDLSVSFRGFSGSVTSVDCSYSADKAWFDAFSAWTGYSDTTYWSGISSYRYLERTAAETLTHLCNYQAYNGTGSMKLSLAEPIDGIGYYTLYGIDPGERGLIVLSGSTPYVLKSKAIGPTGGVQTNLFRHGIMVP